MQERKGIISTLREKLNSSTSNVTQSTDSLKHKLPLDSLKQTKWSSQRARDKYDSIQHVLRVLNKLTSVTDSVTKLATKPIDKVKQSADSLQQKAKNYLQGKLDSVEQKLNKPLDKVNSKISSIEKPIEQKLDGVNEAIDQKTDKLQTGIQQGFEKATDGTVAAPIQNIDAPDISIPSTQGIITKRYL